MNILQDILGLFKRKKIVKTLQSNDYIPLGTFKSKKEALKPNPKMESVIISAANLKNYVGGGGGGEDLAATLVAGNTTGGTNLEITAADKIVAINTDTAKNVTVDFGLTAANRFFAVTTDNEAYLTSYLTLTNTAAYLGDDNALLSILGGNVNIDKGTFRIKDGTFFASTALTTLTANRTYTFQDASGTVAFLSDVTGGGGYIQTATTVNATPFLLTSSKAIDTNSVQSFVTRVTAIATATGDVWCHEFRGAIKQFGGVTSIVDTVTDEMIAEDVATAAWGAAVTAVPGSMSITVTGAAVNIKWKSKTIFSEIVI